RTGNALDGELALELVAVTLGDDVAGDEGDFRELLDVEEVFAADVAVAVGIAGVEARGLDRGADLGVGHVLGEVQGGFCILELAADLADACVADGEGNLAVRVVEGPGAGGDVGGK